MGWALLLVVLVLIVVALGLAIWRPLRTLGHEIQVERASELFQLQRERLQAEFFKAAAATGKPRGLRWTSCQWDGAAEFARERSTRQLAALLPVTIQFEAVEGGDMEGLPAVSNLRNASAVFFFHRGQWLTVGKAIFNMNPDEALVHFQKQYDRVTVHH